MPPVSSKKFIWGLGLLSVIIAKPALAQQKEGDPVETKSPNSDYQSAFKGQTRAPGVKTQTAITATVITSDLKSPWGLCVLPDGRFLISEKVGTMRILKADGEADKKITNLPAVVAQGQGGLLDVNIDPDFANNRMVYWDYAEAVAGGNVLAIAKGKLAANESSIEDIQVIYRALPAYRGPLQYGSRILFDKQGNLFVSTGERSGNDIRMKAQDLDAAIGKVIHITKNGLPVANGPFAGKAGALPEIFAYGFRNPEGMAWNPVTGELWEAEFGPRGGDEINIIRAGNNYGWPVVTYGIEYSGSKVGDGIQQKEGVTQPVYYWDPSISPSGIAFYTGTAIPEWKNNLFVGGLGGSHIARLIISNNKVTGEERLLKDKGERWRALTTGKDGALYGVTDSGKLYRIGK
ncbi:PQQ-dependent sugar dehydrogenase [Mucilaginibacter gilvus]|uniref:PQQ-dependent sugar dehydrogenase n=1 Tax=Mucilaginibacter gilvus TaxID=2305909 RepID=A0A444MJA3_9SPHI|nr:PQQ-dependent sugar dehydrogenase [Mucilaginibacter gilvus]RWY48163.1 PQQ-dependent sugar dehydrogenase [Mucilaginibacter gilvus]